MSRYVPIPPVSIDPRSEAELLNAALRRVFQASNGTINDFASGSPVTALLEGQVYAQGELLYYLNRLPNAVVTEFIGPFLGAMRQSGSAATVQLTFVIETRDTPFVVESGFAVATTASLANGVEAVFLTDTTLIIPPGKGEGTVSATCSILGSSGNVPVRSLNRYTTNLAGLMSVVNKEAASGGADVETLEQVRQRFYSLIRRPNPVSKEDWENFFIDLFGLGTVVSTIPRRSAQHEPLSPSDEYGHVSFFLLKPNLQQPSSEDIKNINNLIKVSCPNEFEAHVYPIELNDVDIFATFKYDANLGFTRNVESLASAIRGYLTNVFSPDTYWPLGYAPSVGDIQGALVNQIGSYTSPDVISLEAFFTPQGAGKNVLNPSKFSVFVTSEAMNSNDLVQQGSNYFSVVFPFTPSSGSQSSQSVEGNVILSKIKTFSSSIGLYKKDEVILYGGAYYVVQEDFTVAPTRSFESYQAAGAIEKTARTVQLWVNGSDLTVTDIVIASSTDFKTEVDLTSQPLAWIPTKNFTIPSNTASLAASQSSGWVKNVASTVVPVVNGATYNVGDYVQVEQIDALRGVVTITYYVETEFIYSNTEDFSFAVREVEIFQEDDFADLEFRYIPRFFIGEYLLDRNTGVYYQALKNFTPSTTDIEKLVSDRLIIETDFAPSNSRPLFRLIAGDVVTLVGGRVTKQYEVQTTFTPIFEAAVYTNPAHSFLVERNDLPQSTADFYDRSYNTENILFTENTGGLRLFRTMSPFTAPVQKADFTGSIAINSARNEELDGNLLQIVKKASCDENIFSRTGDSASLNSLGATNFRFIPDNGLQYITEIVIEEDGTTSYSPSLKNISPIEYGNGTFAL